MKQSLGVTTSTYASDNMKRGLQLEKRIIKAYIKARGMNDSDLCYPGFIVHPTVKYIGFSPDGILIDERDNKLIEVKTSIKQKRYSDFKDQIQLGLLVTGCSSAVFLFLQVPSRGRANIAEFKSAEVEIDINWRRQFTTNASLLYDTYLSWLYITPMNMEKGEATISLLLHKKERKPNDQKTSRALGVTSLSINMNNHRSNLIPKTHRPELRTSSTVDPVLVGISCPRNLGVPGTPFVEEPKLLLPPAAGNV